MPFGGNFHPEWGTLVPAPSFMRTARIVAVATAIGATAGAGVVLSLAGSGAALGPLASSDSAADKPLVIVHSLVQPAEAAPIAAAKPAPAPVVAAAPVNAPAMAQPAVRPASAPAATAASTSESTVASAVASGSLRPPGEAPKNATPLSASAQVATPMPSDSQVTSTPAVPASVAALAEIPAATEGLPALGASQPTFIPDHSGAQKVGSKKPHSADQTQPPHPQAVAAAAQNPPKRKPEQRGLGSLLRRLFTARSASSYPN